MANLAKLVLLCLKLRFWPEIERAPLKKTYQILNLRFLVCLRLCLLPEIERAPLKKTYQILNLKLWVCLGLCLRPEIERAPPEKTYQILNIKLLVCLRLCLWPENEICVYIIYDLWSRAAKKPTLKTHLTDQGYSETAPEGNYALSQDPSPIFYEIWSRI